MTQLPTFPARPVNGGQLQLARPKIGRWLYQPKFNGWRAVVHTPSGTMFNRQGARLSIAGDFAAALREVRHTGFEWLDCEALERRHGIGRGSLVILDWIPSAADNPERRHHENRRNALALRFQVLPMESRIADNSVVLPFSTEDGVTLWRVAKEMNRVLDCEFYEGVVAWETNSAYPMQLRSPDEESACLVKHRWKF